MRQWSHQQRIKVQRAMMQQGHQTLAEIAKEIRKLMNGKATGESGIVAELLKAGCQYLVDRLGSLFRRVWEEETVPGDWRSGVVIPLHKKGDKMNLDNYRGITLMDVVGKVFSGIIRNRIERAFQDKIAEEQAGFRKGRGCVDQAYSLAQTVLKRLEKQKDTFLCFVDLKKAYDSVWRDGLFRKMEQEGVPLKLVRLVRAWYHGVSVRVRVNNVLSSSFVTKVGVRQGDKYLVTFALQHLHQWYCAESEGRWSWWRVGRLKNSCLALC